MENVILTVHLILALCLIGVVLLQRSEGGGLGIGGGGGGGVMSGRAAATALGKLTWLFGIAFLCTCITLTVIAAKNAAGDSVIERLGTELPVETAPVPVAPADEGSLLPPGSGATPEPPRAE